MKKILFLLLFLIPKVYASNMIAYDMDTKQILYANNIYEKRPVASISKIMTAILAIESNKIDDTLVIGDEINSSYGSGIYIRKGEEIKLIDLVYGLMLRSGNDASFAIAKYVGGSIDNFVKMMNEKAKELGMKNTIYNNPNGLDDNGGNISTVYDMALLTSYAMKNEVYRKITSTKKYKVKTNMNYYSWVNKNKLLFSYKYTTGGKTGYTKIAKRTLVTTASKNNMNIVIVTFNDGNDFINHKNMYEALFKKYKGYNILKVGDVSVVNLKNKNMYYIKENFKYDLTNLDKDNIKIKFEYIDDNINIGEIKVYLYDKELYSTEVYIKETKKVTFLQKIRNFFNRFKVVYND